jgi:magnesium-transporting ATPase (P-type)
VRSRSLHGNLKFYSVHSYSDAGYWFTYFILYNNFIPISLYVTVECVNYVQANFIDDVSTLVTWNL